MFFRRALLFHRCGDSGQPAVRDKFPARSARHSARPRAELKPAAPPAANVRRGRQKNPTPAAMRGREKVFPARRKAPARPRCAARRFVAAILRNRLERQNAQGILINLAGSQARQFGHDFKMRRHHVMRQPRGQRLPQFCRLHFLIRGGNHKCHQSDPFRPAGASPPPPRATPGWAVSAAVISSSSTRKPRIFTWLSARPRQCTGPPGSIRARSPVQIHFFLAGIFRERIRHEFFRRQIRPAEITRRQSRPENAQLADFARRQRPPLFIHHQQSVIWQRPADGHGFAAFQFRQRRRHGSFGRAVGVENFSSRPRPIVAPANRDRLRRRD